MTKPDAKVLIKQARLKAQEIMEAPIVDPEAPPGRVRPEFATAECRRRVDAVSNLLDQMLKDVADDNDISRAWLKRRK